jgi:hypothetical protein
MGPHPMPRGRWHLFYNPILLAFSDRLHTYTATQLTLVADLIFLLDMVLTFGTAIEEQCATRASY